MTETDFDGIHDDYEAIVERSISFSGLGHDFFMVAKAQLLSDVATAHFGGTGALNFLDIGCGVGRLHPHLDGMFASIEGCDVSEKSVARARIEHPFARYSVSENLRLPYADHCFDVVTTVCVVHHVPPADWIGFVAEMRRVTKPNGLTIIIEHNSLNPLTRLAVARCPFDADAVLLSPRRAKTLMRAAGFETVKTRNFLFLPTAAPFARRFERLLTGVPLGAQYAAIGTA